MQEKMTKIVVLDGYTENPGDLSWDGLAGLGELTVYDRTPAARIVERIGAADIVYTNKTPITRETLDACPAIRFIGVLATGYNVVDIVAAKEKGIPVANVPSYGTYAVSQFAIAMLLEICHRIGHHSGAVFAGRWVSNPDYCFWDYPLIELAGKTMGIVGFGRIGRTTGRIAAALGMNVLACDSCPGPEEEWFRYVDLAAIYAQSDVIALHCPLLPETENMINSKSIANMKDGVILLNNSRGQLIVEQDLCDALNSGKIYAAGIDVVREEPMSPDNPLLKANNCFITPHISWAPKESRTRLMDVAVGNLKSFLAGRPENVVNS